MDLFMKFLRNCFGKPEHLKEHTRTFCQVFSLKILKTMNLSQNLSFKVSIAWSSRSIINQSMNNVKNLRL